MLSEPDLLPERPAHATLSIRVIDSEVAFLALRNEWNRLADEADPACVFLRHEWFDAAWQWRRHDSQLAILRVDAGGSLCGICPLVRTVRRRRGVRLRVLEFLAVPDTQWCDVLVAPRDRDRVLETIADTLARGVGPWDLIEFGRLAASAHVATQLPGQFSRNGLESIVTPAGWNPTVDLRQSWETYYRGRGRGLKKNNNLVANRLARAGGAEVEWVHGPSDPHRVEECLEHLVRISAASWKRATGLTLDNPGPKEFIRCLTRHAAAQGWLSMWLLRLGGRPTAMEYQLLYKRKVHALRADFDDRSRDVSPGAHLNAKLLEQLFASDAERYYLGPGDNRYKQLWAEQGEPVFTMTLYGRTMAGYLFRTIDKRLRPLLRL